MRNGIRALEKISLSNKSRTPQDEDSQGQKEKINGKVLGRSLEGKREFWGRIAGATAKSRDSSSKKRNIAGG